jgi:phospholipid/cholesterol/gamma-HCH transport system substrate-binding protein
MQKELKKNWQLGFFVCIGSMLVIGTLFFIATQKNLFGSQFRIKAVFGNVSGLKVGDNVRLGGIPIGTVDEIRMITDTSVEVEMVIRQQFRKFIKQDGLVSIITDGLMGDKLIVISPGSTRNREIGDNETLASTSPVETEQILSSLKTSADNAALITRQLSEIAHKVNNGHGVIARLIGDSAFSNNINKTVVNLKKGSEGLNQNMEAAKHNFLLRGYFKKKKKEEEKKQEEEDKSKQN